VKNMNIRSACFWDLEDVYSNSNNFSSTFFTL